MIRKTANEISIKISDALSPINSYNAPIAALVLEQYAESIKKTKCFSEEAYELAKLALSTEEHILEDTEENRQLIEVLEKLALGEGKEIFRGKL